MEVVQLFYTYLHITENWCYRLIKNLPNTKITIVAGNIINKNIFPLPRARFVRKPFQGTRRKLSSHQPRIISPALKIQSVLWHILLIFKLKKTDLLHAHFSFVGWNYLWLAKRLKAPLIISFYGYDYESLPYKEPVWRERYEELFRIVDLILTEGNFGRETLIRMGCPEGKVKVVRLGVDVRKIPFNLRKKPANELRLIQIATFTSKKGYDVTIHAFRKAIKKCPGITLTLVGKDPEGIRDEYYKLICENELNEYVKIIDGIDFKDLHSFLQRFHVFIHPSKYGKNKDSEGGAPVVLLDAQATGMPVLSTTHCDIPDEVLDGKTGILVEENDVEGLADAIESFYLMDESSYHLYCRQARKHVKDRYDAVKNGRILQEVYFDVAKNKRVKSK
ncbi:MAG: glycosyltransferase family 4 protein [Deltaproteobacteria bacterium]|nr:glycosyltransferase family 4 protein [Deltaproteobacteria bacterium]